MDKSKIDYSELGKERIVTVGDLLREIGRRIWIVIILAVAFAVILGAYKYHKDVRAAEEKANTVTVVTSNTSLTDEEIEEVKDVLYVKNNINDLQNYVDNSVLMQIDAANESRVILQYRVDVEGRDTTIAENMDILSMYQGFVNNGGLAAGLVDDGYDLDVQYLQELISFTNYSDSDSSDTSNEEGNAALSTAFVITITQKDQASAEQLADMIEEQLEFYRDTLNTQVSRHELTLINRSYLRAVNTNRRTFKYDRINNILTMQDRVEELEADLTSAQKELLEQYEKLGFATDTSMEEGEAVESMEQTVSVHISRRYVALGALIGIVIAIVYICAVYIMRGSINSANDIRYIYNLRVLGEVKLSGNKKIKKGRSELTEDQQIGALVANLKSVCHENDFTKILFNGDAKLDADRELAEKLGGEMELYGIQTEYAVDLPYSASVIEQLDEYKAVVLFEKIRYSRYSTMEDEIRTCLEHDSQIAGTIVIS